MEVIFNKIKNPNSKKQIENIVIIIALLIIVIIVINSLFGKGENAPVQNETIASANESFNKNDNLEIKLKNIISCINGVSNVEVMITYKNTTTKIPLYDKKETVAEIIEEDTNGGKRKTKEINNEQSIIYEESGGERFPAIEQTASPIVMGVVIVADGAESQVIKENIAGVAITLFDIPSHRVKVFSR